MTYTGGFGDLKVQTLRGRYDFAVDAGAVGTIAISREVPSGTIVLGGFAEVRTAPTSGGSGTLAISLEGANDLITAAAVSGAPWSTLGRKSVVPAFTGATTVKTTAARAIKAVIGTADLTAGVVEVVLFYVRLMD